MVFNTLGNMHLKMKFRDVPGRVATGAFILHSGLEKWGGDEDRATALHGFASGAYPRLKSIPPKQFMKLLAGSEIALGTALLAPVVSDASRRSCSLRVLRVASRPLLAHGVDAQGQQPLAHPGRDRHLEGCLDVGHRSRSRTERNVARA